MSNFDKAAHSSAPPMHRGRSKNRSNAGHPSKWKDKAWVHSFSQNQPSPLGDMKDITPTAALRKILLLIEKQKFQDASQMVHQINQDIVLSILQDLPIHKVILKIPLSLHFLESLYSKLFVVCAQNVPLDQMEIEFTVFQIVKYLSTMEGSLRKFKKEGTDLLKSITNILRIALYVDPEITKVLKVRAEMMDSSLLGIGQHGMVLLDQSVLSMHDALKVELVRTSEAYKAATQKLDELSLAHNKPVTLEEMVSKRSSGNNHQSLMHFTQDQIQDRLYKNKSVLNTIEVNLNPQLPPLIKTLKDRVEQDKNALLSFGRLRREIPSISPDAKVAPIISQYLKSLKMVLGIMDRLMMEEYPEEYRNGRYESLDLEKKASLLNLNDLFHNQDEESGTGDSDAAESTNELRYHERPIDVPSEPIPHPLPLRETIPPVRSGRSRSAERTRRIGKRKQSKGRSTDRLRNNSNERGELSISKPQLNDLDDNEEFQVMMKRISSMAASSPAVGRKRLAQRGVSPAPTRRHQRSTSADPSVLRKTRNRLSSRENSKRPVRPATMIYPDNGTMHQEALDELKEPTRPVSAMYTSDTDPSLWTAYFASKISPRDFPGRSSTHSVDTQSSLSSLDLQQEKQQREAAEKDRDRYAERLKAIQMELDRTKKDLHHLRDQMSKNKEEKTSSSSKGSLRGDNVRELLYRFDKLYSNQRLQVWSSLRDSSESMKDLVDKEELKDKLLFSIVVLAFRSCRDTLNGIKDDVCRILSVPGMFNNNDNNKLTTEDVQTDKELKQFLNGLGSKFDITSIVKEVQFKLHGALKNYSSWDSAPSLDGFIQKCVELTWRMTLLEPSLEAHYSSKTYNSNFHRRSPGSNRNSTSIKVYLWPSLIEVISTKCVYKGIVNT